MFLGNTHECNTCDYWLVTYCFNRSPDDIMTKQEAIIMMQQGKKVKHYLFDSNEFIYMKDGEIHDENDCIMEITDAKGNKIDFWTDRQADYWQDGWIVLP